MAIRFLMFPYTNKVECTAYDNTKLAGNEVPNFKAVNEAAVALADRENRKKFVKDCMVVIERILNRICIKDKNYK